VLQHQPQEVGAAQRAPRHLGGLGVTVLEGDVAVLAARCVNRNLTPKMSGIAAFLRVAASSNPPINRNCNSPLRDPLLSGYWQR